MIRDEGLKAWWGFSPVGSLPILTSSRLDDSMFLPKLGAFQVPHLYWREKDTSQTLKSPCPYIKSRFGSGVSPPFTLQRRGLLIVYLAVSVCVSLPWIKALSHQLTLLLPLRLSAVLKRFSFLLIL